jgi:hypothetical protein
MKQQVVATLVKGRPCFIQQQQGSALIMEHVYADEKL